MSRASTASSLHLDTLGEKGRKEMEESFGSVRTLKIRGATFGPLVSVAYCSFHKCLYVSDAYKHRVCKVAPSTGLSTVLAGYGEKGYEDGYRAEARFHTPRGLAVDPRNGDIFVADMWNHRIRKITPTGQVTTVAGSGKCGFQNGSIILSMPDAADAGSPSTGSSAGPSNGAAHHTNKANADVSEASDAKAPLQKPVSFAYPYSVALNSLDEIFVADAGNFCIRVIAPDDDNTNICNNGGRISGKVSKLAGCRQRGAQNGPALRAQFSYPAGMIMGAPNTRELYIADEENHCVRRINERGDMVETYAHAVHEIADEENADEENHCERRIDEQGDVVETYDATAVSDDAAATGRRRRELMERGRSLWKKFTATTALVGEAGLARRSTATPQRSSMGSTGSTATSNHLDDDEHENQNQNHDGNDNDDTSHKTNVDGGTQNFQNPLDLARGRDGTIYVADRSCNRICMIDPDDRSVATLAGTGEVCARDGPRHASAFKNPSAITVNTDDGCLYVNGGESNAIRVIDIRHLEYSPEARKTMHTSSSSSTLQRGKSCCEEDGEKTNSNRLQPPTPPFLRKGQSCESFDSRAKRLEKDGEKALGDAIGGMRQRVRLWTN